MAAFLVFLSGILTALAFPKFNLIFFAWISLIPLLSLSLKSPPKKSFFLGWMAGFSFYAVLLYWIPYVPAHYGNMSLGLSLLVYILLVLFLGLFWGIFCFLLTKTHLSFPGVSLLLAPFIWISLEYVLTHIFTGFPWGLLGYSQVKNLAFIQTASVAGVYGLSFVLVFFQSMFVFSMRMRRAKPFLFSLGLLLLLHGAGYISLNKTVPSAQTFTASVLQGNVSSDIYWDVISAEEIYGLFEEHMELSRQSYAEGARLIVWPEFSVPLCFSCPQDMYQHFEERLLQFVNSTGTTLLLGTNEALGEGSALHYYNTALCLSPKAPITQYHKIHLVPFGEYTPYKKILSFIEKVTHAIGDITPGTEHVLHQFMGIKFGSPICYEIIFPGLVRKFVKNGAGFLVTITNDGWYGKSSAPFQHFSIAVFRAVENRRFLLRAATTGISGVIDPYGRILRRSELMTKIYMTSLVTPSAHQTFYTKYGDLLPAAGLTLTAVSFILGLVKRRNERKKTRFRRQIL